MSNIKKRFELLKDGIKLLCKNYFRHNVGINAASLAYYLLFAIFPLLIFVSNLLGVLELDISAVTATITQILPKEIVSVTESYLQYVSDTSSHTLMWFSLVFSIWFPMRAVQGLMVAVRRAFGLERPERPFFYKIKQLIFTLIFIFAVSAALALSIVGEGALSFVNSFFEKDTAIFSELVLGLWQYLRFLPIAVLMVTAIGALYCAALDKMPPLKTVLPGLAVALVSWMVVSIAFSFYVENFGNYSIIYGALGTVMVLLIWLYLTAVILILGAEFNAAIHIINSGSK